MWNGSRSGPRGGMPFCANPRGEMFEGRNGPMPGFRGREGMNIGAQDRPPMDMRRFDYPPDMVGRNMGGLDRGRDSPRDFFMPENELDFRRRFEMEQKAPGFIGQGRPPIDMGGRDMQGRDMRGPENQFMDMRERDRFRMDMPGLNMSPMDIRRRLAMESMDRNDHIRERERPQMGMNDIDGFSMDMPPRERSGDIDRRGCAPPLTPRGRFESDMDFRNRMGPSGDFRDRSPQMFRGNDGMNLRGRPDLPLDRQGPEKDMLKVGEPTLRDREFPEQSENRSAFRAEDKSLSEEWCRRMNRSSTLPREVKKRFPPGLGKEGELGEPSQFKDREQPQVEIPAKDRGTLEFSRSEREGSKVQSWDSIQTDVPGRDPSHSVTQKLPLLPLNPSLNIPSTDKEGQQWSRDEKPDSTIPAGGRHPFFPEKSLSVKESHFSVDQGKFKGKDMPLDEAQKKGNIMPGPRDLQSNREGRRDQDYRDIDYRTSSVQKYDYILEDLHVPEKDIKAPKSAPPERPNASGSQDQDYRNANVQDKISNTIAISGIPKTATMQQILDAFAVRDGVPMQGMKIRDVVPGYSSDTAYVEFLNIEDAVHFMESNQGSVKVGSKTALLKYIQPDRNAKEPRHEDQPHKAAPSNQDGLLPCPVLPNPPKVKEEDCAKALNDPPSQAGWERSSTLTPEAWQQQVDKQLQQQEMEKRAEEWAHQRGPRSGQQFSDPVFKESRTMIIKNILPTTSVETILRSLDAFAYLDERNVRLVKGKTPGSKCFCFVDMDSHEHVTRLVDLLTKPRPIMIDGVRVYAEVAKPLKNQNYRRDGDKSNTSLLGYPPDVIEQQQPYFHQNHTTISTTTQGMVAPADPMHTDSSLASVSLQGSSLNQGAMYAQASVETTQPQTASSTDTAHAGSAGDSEDLSYGSDTPDLSAFLFDATSGFYYDPLTTLYYDPNSRYFYNAQTQQYLYWDSTSKIYIPMDGEGSGTDAQKPNAPVEAVAETAATEELNTPSEGAPERREDEEGTPRSEKKEKEKEDKPRSLAAFKIMKDMERWAKIQNRQKDSVRAPSPILRSGAEEKKTSKAADAAFAIFERKTTGGDDLFKKPLAPPRKEEKGSKKPMGSLGLLAADYAAGSDEEEEEKHEKPEAPVPPAKSQPEPQEKEDKLTDWKKMACLLCRRQFPSKDALIRHQQLSDLHKQNMEIHLKIKKSKRELEALENQEKEMHMKETHSPPEAKKRKQQNTWPSSSRDTHKGNERPGLGLETTERNKKEAVVWNNATYKQAVRKAMFARFKELE
ncbi:RNA-binding protein 5 [Ictalurus punctatus]|uniref:RNA-binding protein 5 n=1 Tax=Ictalurus punctatus TaxID=7998 RepID=A0A2D0RZN8_ICTPU|nr:RNA-binding protein 5 [Ictalurus punctatus]XP_017335425.1 RNA-binding protein 5 [Ictalurus punctatus]